jgi:hypothetical protein
VEYECFIKPGFRCAEVEAASAAEAVDFFVSTIVDNLGPEHVVVNNLETEDGNDPSPNVKDAAKPAVSDTVRADVRLPHRVLEALDAASEALEDLGACDDPDCRDANCNHALTKVRDVLAEQ